MKTQKAISKVRAVDELVEVLDSRLFKTLAEPVRVQILKFLMLNGRGDIGTIAEQMPQDRSVISRHLNLMHEAGFLTCEKEGRHMFYDVDGQAFLEKLENIPGKIRECMGERRPL